MSQNSVCPSCGFRTEKLLIICPRCRHQLRHEHCLNCGRCPGAEEKQKNKKEHKKKN